MMNNKNNNNTDDNNVNKTFIELFLLSKHKRVNMFTL